MAQSDELRVSPLELFFDLVFVFAITQIVALIEHDLSPAGVAKGALVLAMIYWGWSLFTWTLNAVGTERLDVRLGLVTAMAMSLLMARVIPDAYGEGGRTTVSGEEKDTRQLNRRLGGVAVYPLDPRNSLKLIFMFGSFIQQIFHFIVFRP